MVWVCTLEEVVTIDVDFVASAYPDPATYLGGWPGYFEFQHGFPPNYSDYYDVAGELQTYAFDGNNWGVNISPIVRTGTGAINTFGLNVNFGVEENMFGVFNVNNNFPAASHNEFMRHQVLIDGTAQASAAEYSADVVAFTAAFGAGLLKGGTLRTPNGYGQIVRATYGTANSCFSLHEFDGAVFGNYNLFQLPSSLSNRFWNWSSAYLPVLKCLATNGATNTKILIDSALNAFGGGSGGVFTTDNVEDFNLDDPTLDALFQPNIVRFVYQTGSSAVADASMCLVDNAGEWIAILVSEDFTTYKRVHFNPTSAQAQAMLDQGFIDGLDTIFNSDGQVFIGSNSNTPPINFLYGEMNPTPPQNSVYIPPPQVYKLPCFQQCQPMIQER